MTAVANFQLGREYKMGGANYQLIVKKNVFALKMSLTADPKHVTWMQINVFSMLLAITFVIRSTNQAALAQIVRQTQP